MLNRRLMATRSIRHPLPSGALRPTALPLALCGRACRLRCGSAAAIALVPVQPGLPLPGADGSHHGNGTGNGSAHGQVTGNGNGHGGAANGPKDAHNSTAQPTVEQPAQQQQQEQEQEQQHRPPPRVLAAALAAQFPAVAPLPRVPASGTLRDVVPYLLGLALQERALWWRMAAAVGCMVVTKVAGINLPLVFKDAVDALAVASVPAALKAVMTYGALECVKVLAKERQLPFFAPVSQAVTRRVAYHTFAHVLSLDTRFHLDRRTGRVSRILERGNRAIGVLYRALVFTFLPTGLELAFVAALLAGRFGPQLAAVLGATFAAYVAWTVYATQKATDVRKEVNELDNLTSSKAVDALLNFETVTLFGNQRLEVGLYDKHLRDYQSASLRTEDLSAQLNIGQGLILAGGLAGVLGGIVASPGGASGGDLVLASGLIAQLWAPLQFLGWFYRELRAALVDMEDFFGILRTNSNIRDGTRSLPPTPMAGGPQAPASAPPPPPASQPQPLPLQPESQPRPQPQPYSQGPSHSEAQAQSHSQGPPASGAQAQAQGRGLEVELVDVSFGYNHDRQILRGVSLRVGPGESVAVVGSSGSGKSTILKLVTRLYDVWTDNPAAAAATAAGTSGSGSCGDRSGSPAVAASCTGNGNGHDLHHSHSGNGLAHGTMAAAVTAGGAAATATEHAHTRPAAAGSSANGHDGGGANSSAAAVRPPGVYVNGVDVRELRLDELRAAVAVVPQDTALAYDTVRENIRYGRPDASDEEVEAAARMARLHDTVMALPDKYDTVVGERGLKLSGGEKQRVAIARAFLRSPRLLICDEATSALDSATEAAIMESLGELATGRSALFVAHRLSTVRGCDRIVVLRGGVVIEEGSHEQLMARRGEYAEMWELQARGQRLMDGGITDSESEMSDAEELTSQERPAAAAPPNSGATVAGATVAAARGGGGGGGAGGGWEDVGVGYGSSPPAAAVAVGAG